MTAYAYNYKKIEELQPDSKLQNFYGKIVYITKSRKLKNRTILLIKDETASIYLHVTPKNDEDLNFNLRQIIRVHRCKVRAIPSRKAVAVIGQCGCNLITWPPFGDANVPMLISSRSWTRSKEDAERICFLSEFDKDKPAFCVESFTNELKSLLKNKSTQETQQSTQEAALIVEEAVKKIQLEYQDDLAVEVQKIFKIPIKKIVQCDFNFPIDNSFFERKGVDEIIKYVLICNNCFRRSSKVVYTSEGYMPECETCGIPPSKVKVAFRVRIVSKGHTVFFTIPIDIIKGGKYNCLAKSIIALFDSDDQRDEFYKRVEKLRQLLQKVFIDSSLEKFEGGVVARTIHPPTTDIYLTHLTIGDSDFFNCAAKKSHK